MTPPTRLLEADQDQAPTGPPPPVGRNNELSAHPHGLLKGAVDGNAFVKGTWGAAIVDTLVPEAGDILIGGASTHSLAPTSTSSCAAKAWPSAPSESTRYRTSADRPSCRWRTSLWSSRVIS